VDPIQALLLGLRIVPELIHSLAEPGSRVTWLGSEDLGFRYGDYADRTEAESTEPPEPAADD
jgi:hypothetical protein